MGPHILRNYYIFKVWNINWEELYHVNKADKCYMRNKGVKRKMERVEIDGKRKKIRSCILMEEGKCGEDNI